MSHHDEGLSFTQVPTGTIVAFAINSKDIPPGWLLCDGGTIPPQYQGLIQALGQSTTPNLCGRTLIGAGQGANGTQSDGLDPQFPTNMDGSPGYTGGEWVHKLTADELAVHAHTIHGGDFGYHGRSFEGDDDNDCPSETHPDHPLGGTDGAGKDVPHNTMQPYYTVNYIIYAGPGDAR